MLVPQALRSDLGTGGAGLEPLWAEFGAENDHRMAVGRDGRVSQLDGGRREGIEGEDDLVAQRHRRCVGHPDLGVQGLRVQVEGRPLLSCLAQPRDVLLVGEVDRSDRCGH